MCPRSVPRRSRYRSRAAPCAVGPSLPSYPGAPQMTDASRLTLCPRSTRAKRATRGGPASPKRRRRLRPSARGTRLSCMRCSTGTRIVLWTSSGKPRRIGGTECGKRTERYLVNFASPPHGDSAVRPYGPVPGTDRAKCPCSAVVLTGEQECVQPSQEGASFSGRRLSSSLPCARCLPTRPRISSMRPVSKVDWWSISAAATAG